MRAEGERRLRTTRRVVPALAILIGLSEKWYQPYPGNRSQESELTCLKLKSDDRNTLHNPPGFASDGTEFSRLNLGGNWEHRVTAGGRTERRHGLRRAPLEQDRTLTAHGYPGSRGCGSVGRVIR